MDENKVSGEELLEKAERIEQLRKRKIELERMTTGERLKLAAEQGMKKKCEKEIQSAKNAGSDTTKRSVLSVVLQKKKDLPVLERSLTEIEERTAALEKEYDEHRSELQQVAEEISLLEQQLGSNIEKRYQ